MLRVQWPGGLPCDAVHGWDLAATRWHSSRRGHPLREGGGGGQQGAVVDGDEVGVGRVCQLLAEDVMEEVEVVIDEERDQGFSQELKEKTLEEQGLERPGGPSERPAPNVLQALTALQLEVSSLHEENRRVSVCFMHMNHLRRKRHLAQRSSIFQGIPGFWAKAVSFLLQLAICLSGRGGGSGSEAEACAGVGGAGVW